MTVFAFDIDGTLETSAGPIPISVLEGLKCDHYVYLVSPSAARPKGFPIVLSSSSRVESLRQVKAMHPDTEPDDFIYVSDNGDQREAQLAGFRYVWHNEFKVQP
jgi:hypothetical protein